MLGKRKKYSGLHDIAWIFKCKALKSIRTCTQHREIRPPRNVQQWTQRRMNTEENELQTKKQVEYLLILNYTLGVQFSCPSMHALHTHCIWNIHTGLADIMQSPWETHISTTAGRSQASINSIIKSIEHLSLAVCNMQHQNNTISITKKDPQVLFNLQFC